jgi:protein-S-isoprenylcysteine O-methyltransferase Ste14
MQQDIHRWVGILWIGFLVLWTAAALVQKRTVRRQSTSSRLWHLALAAATFMLLASPELNFGFLSKSFVPGSVSYSFLGLSLTILGFAFAIWARVFLRGNWSSAVTVKENHELVRNGPYALVRHPIYSGVLLALMGTVVVFHQTRGLIAFGVAVIALWLKSRSEEQFMTEQFGATYAQYKQDVKALIPFVW